MRNLLFVFIVTPIIFGCNQTSNQATDRNVQETSNEIIFEKLDKANFQNKINELTDVQLIDVRTPEEYQEGFIEGAQNINYYDDNFQEQVSALSKDRAVLVYCKSGGRSGEASKVLKNMGFVEIYDLTGGYKAWSAQ